MRNTEDISGYHAHVYWTDDRERAEAAEIREELGKRFNVALGRWHDKPVGPHPRHSYQVAFSTEEFSKIVPWFMLNRRDLVIFIHPITDDAYTDHRDYPIWLGNKLELNLEVLPRKYTENQANEIPRSV